MAGFLLSGNVESGAIGVSNGEDEMIGKLFIADQDLWRFNGSNFIVSHFELYRKSIG